MRQRFSITRPPTVVAVFAARTDLLDLRVQPAHAIQDSRGLRQPPIVARRVAAQTRVSERVLKRHVADLRALKRGVLRRISLLARFCMYFSTAVASMFMGASCALGVCAKPKRARSISQLCAFDAARTLFVASGVFSGDLESASDTTSSGLSSSPSSLSIDASSFIVTAKLSTGATMRPATSACRESNKCEERHDERQERTGHSPVDVRLMLRPLIAASVNRLNSLPMHAAARTNNIQTTTKKSNEGETHLD